MTTQTATKTTYAVIASAGRHGSGDLVVPAYTTTDLARAKKRAEKMTREFRAGMAKHGGTSGGYVVVEGSRSSRWLGHEADRLPRL